MTISIIVAMDLNGVIGRDGGLPWRLPADLRHFKRTTMGSPIIMGRRTWESIGRPLPGRRNVVVSSNPELAADGVDVVPSLDEAFSLVEAEEQVFVIGGATIYEAAMPRVQRVHLTRVHESFEGDTWFPSSALREFTETSRRERAPDEDNPHHLSFVVLDRAVAERVVS